MFRTLSRNIPLGQDEEQKTVKIYILPTVSHPLLFYPFSSLPLQAFNLCPLNERDNHARLTARGTVAGPPVNFNINLVYLYGYHCDTILFRKRFLPSDDNVGRLMMIMIRKQQGRWKRPLAFILMLVLAAASMPMTPASAASTGMAWATQQVPIYTPPSGGVWYPRLLKLTPQEWLVSFDTNAGGGNTRIVVSRTQNGGYSWSAPVTAVSSPTGNVGNGQMMRLPNGEIWLAYRHVVQHGSTYDIQLNVRRSFDGGYTWSDLPGGLIGSSTATSFKGLWEPHLEMIGNTIAVLYVDDSPAAVGTTGQQNLYMKTWNGNSWGNRITISDGPHFRRMIAAPTQGTRTPPCIR